MKKINKILIYSSILSVLVFRNTWLHNLFAKTARILLLIIVFSRPLADIFSQTKIWLYLRKIISIRQWLWILCWMFALAHGIGYFLYIDIPLLNIFSNSAVRNIKTIIWLWLRAIIFMLFPLVTSNTLSMKKFWRNWKNIQRFTYPAFMLTALHIGSAKWHIQTSIIIITIYTLVRILAYKKIKLKFAFLK